MDRSFVGVGEVEPLVGDVYGIRQYQTLVDGDQLRLVGLSYAQEVVPGVNVSICMEPDRHPRGECVPAPECTCGFYVYDRMLAWTAPGRDVVNAVVRVSGKVVVCEEGLRAEEVEVVALVFDDEGGDVQKQLEKIWSEVPVFTRWEEALDRFPVIALSKGSSRSTSLLAGAWASAAGFLAVMMLMGWSAIVHGFSSAWVGLGFFTSAFLLSWGASLATQPLLKSRGSALALGFVWYLGSFSVLMVTAKTVELAIGLIYAIAVSMFSFFWVHVLWLARVVWFFSSRGRPWSGFVFDNLLFIFSFGLARRAFMFVTKQPLGVGQQGEEWFPPRVRGAE